MANFHRIYQERAEFTNKKVQDLIKAANEAMVALQAGVQTHNGAFCQEDLAPFIGTMNDAYQTIGQLGNILLKYQNHLPARSQKQLLSIHIHTTVAETISYATGQRRIAPAPPKEDF